MLGYFSVGKTSLVERFVKSIFSEKYHSTLGVKVDKKEVFVNNKEIALILWDLAGDSSYKNIKKFYLNGAAGFLVVADGTRAITLDTAIDIKQNLLRNYPNVPFIIILNKDDLEHDWEAEQEQIDILKQYGIEVIQTSAKTGHFVEEAFENLAKLILKYQEKREIKYG